MVMGLTGVGKPDTEEQTSTPTYTGPCLHRAGVTFNLLPDTFNRRSCKENLQDPLPAEYITAHEAHPHHNQEFPTTDWWYGTTGIQHLQTAGKQLGAKQLETARNSSGQSAFCQ